MPLCAFNESIIQKHLCPLADLPIEFVQLVVRQIIPAMLFDAERQHMTQLFSAFIRHLALSSSNEIIVYARHKYSMNRLRSAVSEMAACRNEPTPSLAQRRDSYRLCDQ